MSKRKRKLTPREKREKKRRREEYMTIFINGKQKQVRRPPTIDGMDVEDWIRQNADPIWLHQNELWEYIPFEPEDSWALDSSLDTEDREAGTPPPRRIDWDEDDEIPF